MPYAGLLALLVVVLCAVADGIVLWKSDGQQIDTWIMSPSVILAILSAIANTCLAYAKSEGIIVSWWRKALRGSTLGELNNYWEFGENLLAAGYLREKI